MKNFLIVMKNPKKFWPYIEIRVIVRPKTYFTKKNLYLLLLAKSTTKKID